MTTITLLDSAVARAPGPVNAHSHAFHRVLRGRTHRERGSFWTWREQMYAAASALTPDGYERLATAVFAEMVVSGWTAVGEFHYVHHQPGGQSYPGHDMERALARAAAAAGIRLVLLDTCYLSGGIGAPLEPAQTRFSDGDAQSWINRVHSLRDALGQEAGELVTVGAAIHSVRAVPRDQLDVIAAELDSDMPLHVHLSEQEAENKACLEAYGVTPTGLLEQSGLLTPRLSAVHATHLTADDIALLGERKVSIVMCPTTEADLGDGIGPARALSDAGAIIALGSDQHAVLDPFLEMRALEHHERLGAHLRGRFTPEEITSAAVDGGRRSLGLQDCDDQILVRLDTIRTAGSDVDQLPLTATAADIFEVRIAGTTVARDGVHTTLGDPGRLYADALQKFSL
ncbi:formimidoylglutamate deiminase [Microbacterium profundi]|uniref:formimidoylglutamate deiminase n=1 Tax=Microbacterium profundi TaxID=450380 RepID=UPI0027DF8403|nr:formimidoylglutamate deiminase [Microbacterium profundi]MCE7481654.1 formimidoylglutamate deiminase [Microbacterium profundi]